jgi:hypothetical protein
MIYFLDIEASSLDHDGFPIRYYVSTATSGIWLVLLGGSCEEE